MIEFSKLVSILGSMLYTTSVGEVLCVLHVMGLIHPDRVMNFRHKASFLKTA